MPTVKAVPKTNSSHASTSTSYLKPSHAHSSALPPLLDLTGEIKKQSQSAERGGGFADVHKALWRGENVRLSLHNSRFPTDAGLIVYLGCSQSTEVEFR